MADLIFTHRGRVRAILSTPERDDARLRGALDTLGPNRVARATHVVQRADGRWEARFIARRVVLGPFDTRDAALRAEVEYLRLVLADTDGT